MGHGMHSGTVEVVERERLPADATFLSSVRAALPAWLLARAIVLACAWLAVWNRHGAPSEGPWTNAGTLDVWDAVWYRQLAEHGYLAYGPLEVRFFPLLPAAAGAGHTFGIPAGVAAIAVSWLAALAFAALLHRLMLLETGNEAAARRSAWLIQLVPGTNVLVLGYSEALAGLLAVGFFMALRHDRRPGLAAVLGVLSGLARPTGLLLSAPAAVELLRERPRRWLSGLVTTLSPILATVGFLAFSWYAFGSFLAPYQSQTRSGLRGGVVNTNLEYLFQTSGGGYKWQFVLVLLVITAFLLWLCVRMLPASYTVWAALMVASAVTAFGFHSLPRYLASAFPLVMAAALACRFRYLWLAVIGVCALAFARVTYLNFVPGPVP
jgi:hypothetical protein